MGQVIGANRWVLLGDEDTQGWNVAIARQILCKELDDCDVERGWDWNGYEESKGIIDEPE